MPNKPKAKPETFIRVPLSTFDRLTATLNELRRDVSTSIEVNPSASGFRHSARLSMIMSELVGLKQTGGRQRQRTPYDTKRVLDKPLPGFISTEQACAKYGVIQRTIWNRFQKCRSLIRVRRPHSITPMLYVEKSELAKVMAKRSVRKSRAA